jgi:hypothetical protein
MITQTSESLRDAQETNIITCLAFRGLCGANCEGNATTLLGDLYFLLIFHDVPKSLPVAEHVQEDISAAVNAGDMGVFSVTYVSGHCQTAALGVNCAANRACLTPQFQVPANVFIHVYFKQYSDTKHSVTPGLLRRWQNPVVFL